MTKEIQRSRAIIIQDQKILLVKRTKPEEVYWACPGGIVEEGETKEEGVVREVKEETGLEIGLRDLFFEMPSSKPGCEGQREYFYLADIVGGELGTGTGPELIPNSKYPGKYEFKWYDLSLVSDLDLRPEEIKKLILQKLGKNI